MYENIPVEIIIAKIPNIFSLTDTGYISPYPVLEIVVKDHDADAIYISIADFVSSIFNRLIQVS